MDRPRDVYKRRLRMCQVRSSVPGDLGGKHGRRPVAGHYHCPTPSRARCSRHPVRRSCDKHISMSGDCVPNTRARPRSVVNILHAAAAHFLVGRTADSDRECRRMLISELGHRAPTRIFGVNFTCFG